VRLEDFERIHHNYSTLLSWLGPSRVNTLKSATGKRNGMDRRFGRLIALPTAALRRSPQAPARRGTVGTLKIPTLAQLALGHSRHWPWRNGLVFDETSG
jgi:hypothetical protein